MSTRIREARAGDGPDLHRLVCELADHQDELERVVSTPEELEAGLVSSADRRGCLIAEREEEVVGFVYWYEVFTTYSARPKLYMEDICVSQRARGTGAGYALVKALAQICVDRGYSRLEWLAMQDNQAGKTFYTRIGGKVRQGAETWHLQDEDISMLAEQT